MSTWGTWGLMGVNILLFLLLQFGAEPWRRQRLVRGFEEKVREALAEERTAREKAERVAFATATATAAATASATPTTDLEDDTISAEGEEKPILITAPDVAVPESDIIPPPTPSLESLHDSVPIVSWREALRSITDLNYWRSAFADLVSDRWIALRMRDISLIAVEGLVAGALSRGL